MNVRELIKQLETLDPDLPVGMLVENHEYWGRIYSPVKTIAVINDQIDGPKSIVVKFATLKE